MADVKAPEKKLIVIDAAHSIVGRVASHAAKHVLRGSTIAIINCEQAIMTGRRKWILPHIAGIRADRGQIRHGPYMHRAADKFVRRIVRGMLPWNKRRGQEAYRDVMCYIGVPPQYKAVKAETVPKAHVTKLTTLNYITIEELTKHLGAK
jgi:large subunit ribosomal protein L13